VAAQTSRDGSAELPRKLGLTDSIAIVVGTVIGAGIFLTPNLVARNLTSPAWIITVWIFTGALSFFGALAYAELGSMLPSTGGQYVYLREAYGSLPAFLCGWTFFFVTLSAAIAWLAISFASYLGYFIPMGPFAAKLVSLLLIGGVTFVNYRGITVGAAVQKVLTAAKLAGLFTLIVAAFIAVPHVSAQPPGAFSISHFGVPMIACVLSYDGWVALSFVAGEVRNPKRNLTLAVALGLAIVVTVYVLVNLAYLRMLSVPEIAASDRVGALMAERALGPAGAAIVSLVILLSIAGSANGWAMTAPRIYFAQARDGLFFRQFARVHPRFQTPSFSIVTFGIWSAFLAITGGYETLASYAMFAAWVFYGLTATCVLVLRRREPDRPRPYRMPGYPVTLLLFVAVAIGFVTNTFIATPGPALVGTVLILTGVPVYLFWKPVDSEPRSVSKRPI
jgi:APA family basic amino acid/polyamine antiporter